MTVKTVPKPLTTNYVHWSPDGTKILLTSLKKTGETTTTQGFVVVTPATRTAEIINVPGLKGDTAFAWTGTGDSVATIVEPDSHVYDLLGKQQRTLPVVGGTLADPRDMFTVGGGSFVARCQDKDVTFCVWDTATGAVLSEFESGCDTVLGLVGRHPHLLHGRRRRRRGRRGGQRPGGRGDPDPDQGDRHGDGQALLPLLLPPPVLNPRTRQAGRSVFRA